MARRQLQWGGRLVLLHDVAAGMSFLHGRWGEPRGSQLPRTAQ